MSVLDQEATWCSNCCSQHEFPKRCPGHVEVTGTERPGRRFVARRGASAEGYQILLAEAGELWLARIVTLPGELWGVPGGRGTMKFYDEDPTEAERLAVLFVYKRCRSLGIEITELAADIARHADDTLAGHRQAGKRYEQLLPAMFGVERPAWPARIANVSGTGLFLATSRPEPIGTRVHVVLRFQHFSIPLVGTVVWVQPRPEGQMPAGMGLELDDPPFAYGQYVASLEQVEG